MTHPVCVALYDRHTFPAKIIMQLVITNTATANDD